MSTLTFAPPKMSAMDRYRQLLQQGAPQAAYRQGSFGYGGIAPGSQESQANYQRELDALKSLAEQEAMFGSIAGLFNSSSGAQSGQPASGGVNPYEQRLLSLLDDPSKISQTGAYKFQEAEGRKALERSAASRGMLGSGNTLAALMTRGQQQAHGAYDSEANRLADLVGKRYGYDTGMADVAAKRYAADRGASTSLAETMMKIQSERTPVVTNTPGGTWTKFV